MSTNGWRQIMKGVDPVGVVDAMGGLEFRILQRDPSLGDQLAVRRGELGEVDRQGKFDAYLDAARKAPHASPSTKRKWMKRLGL